MYQSFDINIPQCSREEPTMLNHHVSAGASINRAITEMIELAKIHDDTVKAEFNGVELTVRPDDDADTIEAAWQQEMDRLAEEYRNSSEGKRADAEAEQRKLSNQNKVNELMVEFSSLDFSDLTAVIDWMERLTDPSDHIGVTVPSQAIVTTFREHGFEPSVNTGDAFNGDDRENFARYLIGQGLDGLNSMGAVYGMFHKFADYWREKFSPATV